MHTKNPSSHNDGYHWFFNLFFCKDKNFVWEFQANSPIYFTVILFITSSRVFFNFMRVLYLKVKALQNGSSSLEMSCLGNQWISKALCESSRTTSFTFKPPQSSRKLESNRNPFMVTPLLCGLSKRSQISNTSRSTFCEGLYNCLAWAICFSVMIYYIRMRLITLTYHDL